MRVHFGQRVGKVAVAGPPGEPWIRQRRKVHLCVRNVGVERPARGHAALQEIDRPTGDLLIDQAALLEVVDSDVSGRLAFPAFHHVHWGNARRLRLRIVRPKGFVRRARNAVPFVEAPLVGQPFLNAAEMPLAECAGGVAGGGERIGNRHFPARQAIKLPADRNRLRAGADRKPPCHDGRAARRALPPRH
jgi:hypothetical protein